MTARRPLDPEYHLARLLLLVDAIAGRVGSLDGLTKLAKLDFLVRYPSFLRRFLDADGIDLSNIDEVAGLAVSGPVESPMIRYKYGPWDDSYYPLIGAMLSRGLVEEVTGRGRVSLRPTPSGRDLAAQLRDEPSWAEVIERCRLVAYHYNLSGNALKERIYSELPEVVDLPLRTEI